MTQHILRSEEGADAVYPRQLPAASTRLCTEATLAPRLVHALIRQKIDPVAESGTAATSFFFNQLDAENCFPGEVRSTEHPNQAFWSVEDFVNASRFQPAQPR